MIAPLVSFVIPCFRSEKYVKDIICDVLRQTFNDWELIAVGNGPGQDLQKKIFDDASASDPRISYVSILDIGVSKARNAGIEKAAGKWIAFVDADDRLPAYWLDNILKYSENDPDIVVGGITYKNLGTGEVLCSDLALPSDGASCRDAKNFLPLLLSDIAAMHSPCSKLYKRDLIIKSKIRFRESFSIYEDCIFNLELALSCTSMSFLRQTGYEYIQRPGESAIGRSHDCLADAIVVRRDLIRRVLDRAGCSSDEVFRRVESQYALDALDICLNEFREGAKRGFRDKTIFVRNIFADARLRTAWKHSRSLMSNLPLAAFRMFHALNAPWLCVAAFSFLFSVRRFWRRKYASP